MSVVHEIKHKVCGRDANKAWGEAQWLISIEAALRMLFCIKHKQGNALTILKNLHLNINMFAGSLYVA